MHLTLAESQGLDIIRERERESYHAIQSPDHLFVLLARHPAWGSLWTHSADLHLNSLESDCTLALINPLSMCVWQYVDLHVVVCSQQCMYGPVCPVKKLA